MRADGLEVVGVEWKNDDADAARAFAASHGATWQTVTDPDGSRAAAWLAVAPPQTYFIGRDGIIRSRQIGTLTRRTWTASSPRSCRDRPLVPAIAVRGLHKSYAGRAAVAGLDLDVAAGSIVALLGPNGAGQDDDGRDRRGLPPGRRRRGPGPRPRPVARRSRRCGRGSG